MGKQVLMAVSVACVMSTSAATISWTSAIITGEGDVSTQGTLVEALNFSGGTTNQAVDRNTTINGVTFSGFVNGTNDNNWADPNSGIFSANSDKVIAFTSDNYDTGAGGLAAYDVLMSQFLNDSGVADSLIILQSLTISQQYEVQLFVADTRSSQSNSVVKIDSAFTSDVYAENAGVVLTGTFGADAATQSFNLNKYKWGVDEKGLQLNAYQLRKLGVVEIPGAPTGLGASPDDGLVELDWNDNPESDIDFYRVKRSTASGGPYSEIGTPTASIFTDTSVSNNLTYYYVVSAVDTDTNESVDSKEVSATPAVRIDLAGDSDGDGSRDTLELMLGTDPFDGTNFFGVSIESIAVDEARLTWPSKVGVSYSVGFTTNLASNVWQEIAGPFAGTGTEMAYTDNDPERASGQSGFYVAIAHLPPPNIVFLMSDDHVGMAMGNMDHPDHPEILTPSMDILASRGIRFDRAYANTSICRPSRATTLTGLFEYKHVTNFGVSPNALSTNIWNESYPILLKNAGYRIAFAGKWGFGMELTEAEYSAQFDKWGGFSGDSQGKYTTAENPAGIAAYASEYPHVSRALGAFGRDFIQESVSSNESFCLTIFFKAPHMPFNVYDAADANKYDHVTSFTKPTTWDGAIYNNLVPDQPRFARPHQRRWTTDSEFQAGALGYYRLVSGMDAGIGMILDELEARGVAHNTVVIYTSDNGYFLGAHGGWHGKVLPHEEGSRIPLIVYDPRAPLDTIGKTSQAVVGSIDYAPTILSYAAVAVPSNMDGQLLQPLISNPDDRVRDAMLLIQNWAATDDDLSRALSVVTEQYKYIFWPYGDTNVVPAEEVYEIPADPFETNNIASTLNVDTLNQLRSYYDGFLQDWTNNVPAGVVDYERMGEIYDRSIPHTSKTFSPIPAGDTKYRDNYQDVTGFPYPY